MRVNYNETVPEHEAAHTKITCDICGGEVKDDGWSNNSDYTTKRWANTIEHFAGTVYPEGGSVHGKQIDLCFDCIKDKVLPLICEHFEIEVEEEDRSW